MMACGKEKKTLLQYKYQKSNFQLRVKSSLGSHWLYFASLCGPENSHHPSANQKQNENQSQLHHPCFSRASGSLLGFTLYSHWLLLRYSINNAIDWLDLFPSWPLIGFYHLAESSFSRCNVTVLTLCVTWLD